ncbi:MAG: flagellar hook assembly protein FlgD [Caulobacteraceae bacterium]|nr:flagellar hook assembly protein FlgD [Caulobacteraceae bacterium]
MVAAVTTVDSAAANTASTRTSLATNFDTFLTLLTAQLKNQDPLSPMDSTQFTQQLTQMTGVQQQLLTNDLLTSLLAAQNGGGLANGSNYIGKEVTAVWSADKLTDGKASWSYELGADATKATLSVLDSTGKVVWTGPATDLKTGTHDFTWDGKTTAGGQMSDGGVYTLKVAATDAKGNAITSQVLMTGTVDGVELYDNVPYLNVGNTIIPLSTVISLQQKKAAAETPTDTNTPATADA